MPGTVDIKFVFTGICTFSPENVPATGMPHSEVVFVMPVANKFSKPKPNKPKVPPHKPFFIAPESDVAVDAAGDFIGREPDGQVADYLYWTLNAENLRLANAKKGGVTFKAKDIDNVISMPKVGKDAKIKSDHVDVKKASKEVAARFIVEDGALKQSGWTDCEYEILDWNGTSIYNGRLADEIAVNQKGIPLNASDRLEIKSTGLDDKSNGVKPIVLQPSPGALVTYYIACGPEADIGAVVNAGPNHTHGDDNVHFALHYLLSDKPPADPPIPTLIPNSCSGGPPLPGTDTCPPASS